MLTPCFEAGYLFHAHAPPRQPRARSAAHNRGCPGEQGVRPVKRSNRRPPAGRGSWGSTAELFARRSGRTRLEGISIQRLGHHPHQLPASSGSVAQWCASPAPRALMERFGVGMALGRALRRGGGVVLPER